MTSPFIRVAEAFDGRPGAAECLELLKAMCERMGEVHDHVEAWEDGPREPVRGLDEVGTGDTPANDPRRSASTQNAECEGVLRLTLPVTSAQTAKFPKGWTEEWRCRSF